MGIDMTNFKVIYKDQIYNCLSILPTIDAIEHHKPKVKFLEVMFINSDNRVEIISDEAFMFQFISK